MDYEPVEYAMDEYRIARLPSGNDVTVTVHRYEGGPGPTVYVQAAQHGIELNGPATLRRLHERLCQAEVAGTVVVVPIVNPLAFDHRSYMAPSALDVINPNLNRVWPGDDEGTLQEQMADRLWELVEPADAVVDLHTGTAETLEHVRFREDDDDARALAEAFGSEVLLADQTDEAEQDDFAGKLRIAASRAGIPAITPELSNSRRVDRAAVRAGLDGVVNVLGELDVLPDDSRTDPPQRLLVDEGTSVVAEQSGLFELAADVQVGEYVTRGTEIGTVYSPATFESLQSVVAEEDGVTYTLRPGATVVAGERVAGIAAPRADDAGDVDGPI